VSDQTQTDDFAGIAKPHPAPQAKSPAVVAAPGDDFAHIAKPHPVADAAPADDGGTIDDSGTSLADLSASNPNNEGLYHMKDKDGHSYAVPFSNVEMVDDFRNSFADEKEAKHYERDLKAKDPGLWEKFRKKVESATEPTTLFHGAPTGNPGDPVTGEMALNTLKRTGRGLFGVVDFVPQTFGALRKMASDDPKISEEGERELNGLHPGSQIAERAKEFKHDWKKDPKLAMANTAGDALTIYITDKAAEAVKATPEVVREKGAESMRNRAGTGTKSTEKLVRDTAAKNDELMANAKTEGEKAHAEKVKTVREQNDAAAKAHEQAMKDRSDLIQKKAEASRKAAELRTRLHNHVKDIHDAGAKWFDQQYAKLGELTEGVKVDLSPLAEAVTDAKLEDVAGSDTKVPIFEDVLRRAKGEAGAGGEKPANWADMAPDEQREWANQNANDRGISYKDLTGYWRELGRVVKSTADADIRTAAVKVRGVIEGMQREAARLADTKAAEKALRDHKPKPPSAAQLDYSLSQKYKNFAESYRDAGSVGTKAANSDNAVEATKPYLAAKTEEELSDLKRQTVGREPTTEGKRTNATEWAGRNSAEDTAGKRLTRSQRRAQTEKLIDQTRKAHEDLDALGKIPEPPTAEPPTPEPEYTPPAPETLNADDLKRYKREQLNKKIDQLESNGMRIGVKGIGTIGLAELLTHLTGGSEMMMAGIAGGGAVAALVGPKIIARLLKMPGVAEKLLTITKADVEALEKLPANQRVEAEQTIINMSQQAKMQGVISKNKPTPLAAFAKQDIVKAKAEAAKAPATEEKVVVPAEPERGVGEVKLPVTEEAKPAEPVGEVLPSESKERANEFAATNKKLADAKAEAQRKADETGVDHYVIDSDDGLQVHPVDGAEHERNAAFSEFIAEPKTAPKKIESPPVPAEAAPTSQSNHQPSRRLEDLKVDPKRFQYKLGGNKRGVTDALSDAKWDQDLADPIHIWEDPEDGHEYVVNGHHRYDLAEQAGADRIDVNKIDNKKWPTAADARRFGALKNIADGNGTSVDAAKFMREKGYTVDDLRETGLSLKKNVAKEGLALSRLDDHLFDQVVDGRIDPKIGAAIGEASDVASDQDAILKDVQRREKAGRPVTPEQIRESARLVKSAPTHTETTTDLFGSHEESRNLFLEMGEVSEYIQRELADERRVFKRVSSKGASEQLAKGKNVINPEENAKIAQQAAQQRELYLKRSTQAGPIHATLEEAAQRLAEGENANAVKSDAFEEIRQHLAEELGTAE